MEYARPQQRASAALRLERLSTLRDADFSPQVAAFAPADVGERIAQHMTGARIDGDFHVASMEAHGRTGRRLFEEPDVEQLGGGGLDLARRPERIAQAAHRLADVIGGDPRYRTDGIAGMSAPRERNTRESECNSNTQHSPLPMPSQS
jgi:hypothetical protein